MGCFQIGGCNEKNKKELLLRVRGNGLKSVAEPGSGYGSAN